MNIYVDSFVIINRYIESAANMVYIDAMGNIGLKFLRETEVIESQPRE